MTSTPVMSSINTQAMSLMNSVTNNISKTGGTSDFKDFMNLKGGSEQSQPAEAKTATVKPDKGTAGEESKKPEDVKPANVENKQDSTAPVKETREVSDKDVTAVDEAIDEVKEVLKEELEITDEELMTALENLGLNPAALLDTDRLPAVIAEVTDSPDVLAIATDPELYEALGEVKQVTVSKVAELTTELNIPAEDFNEALKNIEELPVKIPDELPKETEIPVQTAVNTETEAEAESIVQDIPEAKPELKSEGLAEKIEITVSPKAVSRQVVKETEEAPDEEPETKVTFRESHFTVRNTRLGSKTETFTPVEDKLPADTPSFDTKEEVHVNPAVSFAERLIGKAVESFKEITEQPLTYTEIDAADVLNQMTESIRVEVTPETSEINLRLHPESLGSVTVKVSQNHEGVMRAQFTTQNESVKAIVESQAIVLKEALESKGVKVEAVEVMVQSHEFERNLSDRNRGNQAEEQAAGKRRIRRINLTEGTAELTEETEEDTLVREMMAANGNTIDYSA